MACDTPGERSMVTGVRPRKLPPVVTCAPEGTERTVMRASAAPSSMGPMVCGVPAFTTTLEVHSAQARRRHLHAADARVHFDLRGRHACGFAVDFDLRARGHRADADHAERRLERDLELLLLAAAGDGETLDVIEMSRRLERERAIAGRHLHRARNAAERRAVGGYLGGDTTGVHLELAG